MGYRPDMPVFLELPQVSGERVLHPGTVIAVPEEGVGPIVARFDDPELPIEEGTELQLYYEEKGRFFKQVARVRSAEADEHLDMSLEVLGELMSAESREHYRASAFHQNVFAVFDGEETCEVVDISERGLAIYSGREHPTGTILDVSVAFEGQEADGKVSIQSIRRLGGSRFRYGLLCLDGWESKSLRRVLNRITIELQRRVLARLAGRD